MPLSREEIQQNAVAFSEHWQDESKWNEKSFAQSFVRDFLAVFGINAIDMGKYERRVGDGFADYLLPKAIAVEMKSHGKNLEAAYKQLLEYVLPLPADEMPELLMVSDFETIVLHHRSEITKKRYKPIEFKTKDLIDHVDHFRALAGLEKRHEFDEAFEINVRAAEKMANLHDDLERLGYEGHVLEIYLVRLLFCLFAEDTGIFPKDAFLSFVMNSKEDGSDLSGRIVRLFDVLNMPDETRVKRTQLPPDLRAFRYINGGLFKDPLPPADFDAKMRLTLIDCCRFDWSKISPAIFGAMVQGVMDKDKRREIGVHYTSEENILKLIAPLFMDDLRLKFNRVKGDERRLDDFHEHIAKLKFLDPACGCGNFLMIAYRELRRLEIDILRIKKSHQKVLDISVLLKVTIEQFYGIEIEDFPCEVAKTSLWLMDHLMNVQASKELGQYYVRLPLEQSATIVHGNALQIDWEDVVPKSELSYILGNPPYVGHQWRKAEQVADMKLVFRDGNKVGKLDYVCCWYKRAIDYMRNTQIRTAFVSTNSIVQGESVAILWKPFFEAGIEIVFAYRSFRWTNEAKGKAAVHCVIIGFANKSNSKTKWIFSDGKKQKVAHINGYLLDAPDVYTKSRGKPLCKGMPKMSKGSQPTDGGNLILSPDERNELITAYPQTKKWIRRYVSSDDFIHNKIRYCLWLKGVLPADYRPIRQIMQRLKKVADSRQQSPTESVRLAAETPMLFTQVRQHGTKILAVPEVTTERRKYIPIGYLDSSVIASNKIYIVPHASLYLFGMLTSNVHMAWMRVIAGRLGTGYSYSPSVYNNFPLPNVTDKQKEMIEKLAQAILDTRKLFPKNSLADLYDPLTMPPELLKAHRNLDNAVMKLYKFKQNMSESAIVAALMEMYQKLTTPPTMIPEEKTKMQRKKQNKT
ncbi:MAG: N-6 DNA methylase [Planctomycetaceae bacterium]|nr:N-6 DNA methylase [Planctomycetaceae bacterium]